MAEGPTHEDTVRMVGLEEEGALEVAQPSSVDSSSPINAPSGQTDVVVMQDTDAQVWEALSTRNAASTSRLLALQRKDEKLERIRRWVQDKQEPVDLKERTWLRNTVKYGHWFVNTEGILRHAITVDGGERLLWRIVIPQRMIPEVLAHCHDSPLAGHLGVIKTYRRVAQSFYWPGMENEIMVYVLSCRSCNLHKARPGINTPLQQVEIPQAPWQVVSADYVGPLTTSKDGFQYILVISDHLTRYSEAIPMIGVASTEFLKRFFERIICRWGCPRVLISDNGTVFTSKETKAMMNLFRINQRFAFPYHPQTNGITERFNWTMMTILAGMVSKRQTDWTRFLPAATHAYNTSHHPKLRCSPFEANHGRTAESALTSMLPEIDPELRRPSSTSWTEEADIVHGIATRVQNQLTGVNMDRQTLIDAHRLQRPVSIFKVGDLVFKTDYMQGHRLKRFALNHETGERTEQRKHKEKVKITPKFTPNRTGPYVITAVQPSGIHYELQSCNMQGQPHAARNIVRAREHELIRAVIANPERTQNPITVNIE